MNKKGTLEDYFSTFRDQIIGADLKIKTPYHAAIPLLYMDWTASGRAYRPIEEKLVNEIMPLLANTHTDTNHTGSAMTYALHKAREIIKKHVGAGKDDVLITSGAGMTGVVNKLQRILGLKLHESFKSKCTMEPTERPIVFITHMEHHSNQTSWLETIAEVKIIQPDENGLVSLADLEDNLIHYKDRKVKIGAFTSCSNVTGLLTQHMDLAAIMHRNGGYCFVDFACSAPYITINMHEDDDTGRYLDAIYFSPHKFLGGPGSTGVLVFNKKLYSNQVPDHPGGGTVTYTDPWGRHQYFADIEMREDGGTPPFLQTMKAAMSIRLKEEMSVDKLLAREAEQLEIIWNGLKNIPNLHILEERHQHRMGVLSFYIDGLHYNLGVKLLNDRFGIQTRGGCSCAGTYGHFLLNIDQSKSNSITDKIAQGDCSLKPGWIRASIHPTQTNTEIEFLTNAIRELAANFSEWSNDYDIDYENNTIRHKAADSTLYESLDLIFEENYA